MNGKLHCKRLLQCTLMVVLMFKCFSTNGQNQPDTINAKAVFQQQNGNDSIARFKFIQDSIKIREQFVRDSIQRRKQILDSLTFLQVELPPVLEAIYWTTKEDMISYADKIPIIGDSVLGDYVYYKLPLSLSGPYAPWKENLSLNRKQTRIIVDPKTKKIITIQASSLRANLSYANEGAILIIQEPNIIQNSSTGKFFKTPIDSVFFNRNKRITKIKRYVQFYSLVNSNQKGSLLFTNLFQVKQYQYGNGNQFEKYEFVKFVDRNNGYDPVKVGYIVNYTVTKQGNNYLISRRNNPANAYSDGTFTLEYDANKTIKSISFNDLSNAQVWYRSVVLNKDGNVNCYIDTKQGRKINSTCMVYHNEPKAQYPVEIIDTSFEQDGIDYWQKNTTTKKIRVRNKLTLEWGPWKDE